MYFAIFDGHAGTGAALMASKVLHAHLKDKLTSISHMLILSQEEFSKQHLNHGLILNVTTEKLVVGALEETFIEFVSSNYFVLFVICSIFTLL